MAASTTTTNVNIGVLGHVDSGKTSVVSMLSTTLSTAALDKHPQSKERGITLDLGFSSFSVDVPEHLWHVLGQGAVQFTLVDCPGHSSLIRTVLGGVQIIDTVLLVIDVTKGIQAQTAECLVLAEVTASSMLVVLNKVDLLPPDSRSKALRKLQRRLAQTLACTRFAGAPMVATSTRPDCMVGAEEVQQQLLALVAASPPVRRVEAPLVMAVDHCFALRGQGTILTGTLLQGQVAVGQVVEVPALKLQRTVRSMQMFKQPVRTARAGDRVGVCVPQLDASLMERGLLAAPGAVPTFGAAVVQAHKIRFYDGRVASRARFHVSIGHATTMAQVLCFGAPSCRTSTPEDALADLVQELSQLAVGRAGAALLFDFRADYLYQDELYGLEGRPAGVGKEDSAVQAAAEEQGCRSCTQWLLLQFDHPVTAPADAVVMGARLDADSSGEACRLAFCGRMCATLEAATPPHLQRLRVYKVKQRQGTVERLEAGGQAAVCRGMFKRETDQSRFLGLRVTTPRGEAGTIASSFGKSGKCRVVWDAPLAGPLEARAPQDNHVILQYKKYIFSAPGPGPDKKQAALPQ